jgi:hypothetical protein
MLVMLACTSAAYAQQNGPRHYGHRNSRNSNRSQSYNRTDMIPAGTAITIRLDSEISTDSGHQGDAWAGTVEQAVVYSSGATIPARSPGQGVVSSMAQGTRNTHAQLALALRQVTLNGQSQAIHAQTEPIVAGSQTARKLGAVAVGAAAGALLGHTVARDNHGTRIGGVVGGAAGYRLTRNAMRTLVLKPGTLIGFVTSSNSMMARR